MEVTLYHPAGPCPKCAATKLYFQREGVDFTPILVDEEVIQRLKDEGHQSFPVVVVTHDDGSTWTWSDFRHDEIKRLAKVAEAY